MHIVHTYTEGFQFKAGRWTTHKVIELCSLLEEEFPGETFLPEPICEGGILFGNYPGDQCTDAFGVINRLPYKTMRIRGWNGHKWPWIHDRVAVKETWSANPDVVICSNMKDASTWLKAFDGAPAWTIEEIKKFAACMNSAGLVVKKSSYPKIHNLSEH